MTAKSSAEPRVLWIVESPDSSQASAFSVGRKLRSSAVSFSSPL